MRKLTDKHIFNINNLMLKTTEELISFYTTQHGLHTPVTQNKLNCCVSDVIHNVAALDVFNKTLNVQQLHNNIMRQDTFVREYYINTLRYIEENALIPANSYCCV